MGRFSPLKYLGILVSVATGNDLPRRFKVLLLKGYTRSDLDEMAEAFVQEYLEHRVVRQTRDIMDEVRRDQTKIMLGSSSIEPVVRAVSKRLEIDEYISSTLEFTNGVFSGRLEKDVTGRKLAELKRAVPDALLELVVSDNKSDIELMRSAKRAIAIVYNGRKRGFWKSNQIDMIDARP